MKIYLTSVASESFDEIVKDLQKPVKDLKVLFIPTAAEVEEGDKWWLDADRDKLSELGFLVTDFDLKNKTEDEVRSAVLASDVIFVSGGNTFYLLEHVKKSGLDKVLRELKGSDKVYIGSSAGSIVAGPNIEPIKIFDEPEKASLDSFDAIGLVDFVVLPHWGKEENATSEDAVMKEFGSKYKLRPVKDGEMVAV